jgi:hypothetical protein
VLTKGLPTSTFEAFRNSLCVFPTHIRLRGVLETRTIFSISMPRLAS